ncbi:MAG TPA: flavodoxin family protein [archaeon]|nr:flavodoxin family protein [archaeon]
MKVFAVLGSRNQQGRTAALTQALLDGLEEKGAATERLFLTSLNLEACRQCEEDGWGICHSEGRCVIEDDFDSIVNNVDGADAVIFSTPVYYGDMSESMRTFTDRLRRCTAPIISRTNKNKNFKPVIGICHAGGGGGGAETCVVSLKKVLSQCGFEVIDMVPVRRQNLPIKLKHLKSIGEWLFDHVETGEWERVIPRPASVR